jgi:hypothetical protein
MTKRTKEPDLAVPTLHLLAASPDGFMTTSRLIRALEALLGPEGEDAEILANRADTKFSQIVRNMVSHRHSAGNIVFDGYADYDEARRGLTITQKGRDHLGKTY